MTVAATGSLRVSALRTEYGGAAIMRLGNYRRGHAAGWVKANAANNPTVNLSAAVPLPTAPVRLSNFRGQAKGYSFTNNTARVSSGGAHYACHVEFGSDWTGNTWPCFYNNNVTMGATDVNTYPLVIYGRDVGPFTFTNLGHICGAGGITNGQAGQHAIYIYNSVAGVNRPIVINGSGGWISGGGGAGGDGGTGGRGGDGYGFTYQPGPSSSNYLYVRDSTTWRLDSNAVLNIIWYGGVYYTGPSVGSPYPASGWNWYYGTLQESYQIGSVAYNGYSVRCDQKILGSGGAGGAGGTHGIGVGYNQNYTSGAAGAAGGAPSNSYAASGGTGGRGGDGAYSLGTAGATGTTGSGGLSSTSGWQAGQTGPQPGTNGTPGGAAGYAIYAATPFGWTNNGVVDGLVGGAVGPT